ncbi:MAG TPA: hypothetical protein VFQ61_01490 [Polyangiaceae bacterium]|nr:hypothetical protein [Polyangiaceae bacterium]
MASKFSEFLEQNKIDPRRLRAASRKLEGLRPEDRALRLAKRNAKKAEGGGADKGGEAKKKPRSGRPVTFRQLDAAKAGKPISGPAKTRLVRAVNAVLTQKKKDSVDLRALF